MFDIKIIFKLIAIVLFSNVSGMDYDDDYPFENNTNIIKTVDCGKYNFLLSNCSCSTSIINCEKLGFYNLPNVLNSWFETNETNSITLLFNGNLITKLNFMFVNNTINSTIEITSINLANNFINSIEVDSLTDSFAKTLQVLVLNGNENLNDLNRISIIFENLKILQINNIKNGLIIEDNFLKDSRFPNLKEIEFVNTRLEFTSKFYNLSNLEVLVFKNNSLNEIPCESLKTFKKLRKFEYEMNGLTFETMYNCFDGLSFLNEIHLKDTKINGKFLYQLFPNKNNETYKSLQHLDLSRNDFQMIPYEILLVLDNLKQLEISINETNFNEPQNTIFTNLLSLDMSNSIIRNLPENAFKNFKNLEELNLNDCSIETVHRQSFDGLENLKYVIFLPIFIE
jgi:Leucine-rich repeat (LRR) protein